MHDRICRFVVKMCGPVKSKPHPRAHVEQWPLVSKWNLWF